MPPNDQPTRLRPAAGSTRRPAASRARTVGVLATLLALAAASTAAAPGVIRLARGDTLSGIAARYGTTVAALQAANGLGTSDRVYAGATLTLPAARTATTTAQTTETTHVVTTGENVTTIAAHYATSVSAVLARNGLNAASILLPGSSLVVPVTVRTVGGSSAPTTSTSVVDSTVSAAAAGSRATLASRPVPSRSAVQALVATTARAYGVDPALAQAVAYQESGFQQRVVSGVDAIGVMQVLPSTATVLSAQIGRPLDLLQATDNVTAGVLLLRQLLRSEGTEQGALAGYYQGLGSLAAQGVLPQTTAYLASVAALKPRFG